jgi:hypothetical protein
MSLARAAGGGANRLGSGASHVATHVATRENPWVSGRVRRYRDTAPDLRKPDRGGQLRTPGRTFTRKRSGVRIPHRPPRKPQVRGTIGLLPRVLPKSECSNACSNAVWIGGGFAAMALQPQVAGLWKCEIIHSRRCAAVMRNGRSHRSRGWASASFNQHLCTRE